MPGTREFVNLDTVWFGISHENDSDMLYIVSNMNDFDVSPNPFGDNVNPFEDCRCSLVDDDA